MCGIFGFASEKPLPVLTVISGLKTLEYRGYDSWGVAAKLRESRSTCPQSLRSSVSRRENHELWVKKQIGKIPDKSNSNFKFSIFNSQLAIGHTRWATHGGVTEKNAHPHLDCTKTLALVHNGIFENYEETKRRLIKRGHKFSSETDTEIIVHLIEEYLKKHNFKDAVRKAFKSLYGLNAIAVINVKTNELIAAKSGSPLIIGIKNNDYFVASDTTGILPHTNQILFIKDSEMAVIKGGKLELISLTSNKKLVPKFEEVNWKMENTQKGKYRHFMMKEIHEQPAVINTVLSNEDQIKSLSKVVKKARGTFFIAAGTAYNACMAGIYLFSKVALLHVNSAIASEFNYLLDFITKKSLVIALSQSGETIDVIEPLDTARRKNATIMGVVNSLGSTIYRMADYKFLLSAGPERAVASTKAYTAKLAFLLLLSYSLANKTTEIRPLIKKAVKDIERLLKKESVRKIEKIADKLKGAKNIYVVGRGVSYSSALEAALKIKEISNIPTEGLAGGELKHGTLALIEKGVPVIVFAPNDETYSAMISNAIEIKSRGGYIIGISYKNASVFDEFIKVQDSGNATLLSQIVPAQLVAYFLAVKLKRDPDKPRNLAKSVTVK